jgi:diguanylate cyclase (GGDEF)-like protein
MVFAELLILLSNNYLQVDLSALSAISLLLVTMALSVVMLFVLHSLSHSDARGIREWSAANGLAALALPLFAARGVLPDLLTVEVANTLLMTTTALMLAGFRRHLGLSVPWWRLAAAVAAGLAAVVVFHELTDSTGLRVVAMSLVHAVLCLAIGLRLHSAIDEAPRRYPYRFTAWAALAIAAVYFIRAAAYGMQARGAMRIDDTVLNLVFYSFGALALPALTLGAVMMTNAGIIARATYAAEHDYLTGARSRRAFFDLAERERARAQRTRASLSLLLFDVDHFKRINDSHGHATGDRVLVEIVQQTRAVIRSIDTCGRLGGEEFAVLLPDTGADMALRVAERLRAGLELPPRSSPGASGIPYTVSIGAATLEPGETIAAMLSRADQALYEAKAGGRNLVVWAQPGVPRIRDAAR